MVTVSRKSVHELTSSFYPVAGLIDDLKETSREVSCCNDIKNYQGNCQKKNPAEEFTFQAIKRETHREKLQPKQ